MVPKLEERYPDITRTRPANVSPHRTTWPNQTLPVTSTVTIGKLALNFFTFVEAGHVLPLHSHSEGEAHITFVNSGRFRIFGNGWERIVATGDRLQFDPHIEHAYEALEPMSQLTNIVY